jgi:hypothetical protein
VPRGIAPPPLRPQRYQLTAYRATADGHALLDQPEGDSRRRTGILPAAPRRRFCADNSCGPASMPWWAVIGGLVGAVQAYAGLTLVNKIGAGTFVGLTVTSALIMSLVIDHFGWLGVDPHPINVWKALGGVLLICGIALIARS